MDYAHCARFRSDRWEPVEWLLRRLPHEWVFRGHEDASWRLQTTLERVLDDAGITGDRADVEWDVIEQFMRRAHLLLGRAPETDRVTDWLALMRHHGCPTRLLDVTRSFYVAGYFAAEQHRRPEWSEIWAINTRSLVHYKCREPLGRHGEMGRHLTDVAEGVFARGGFPPTTEASSCVVAIEPFLLNERMVTQQGLFLMPTSLDASFEECLAESLHLRDSVDECPITQLDDVKPDTAALGRYSIIRVQLSWLARQELRSELLRMNVTSSSLFPGLDGLSRSARWQILHGGKMDDIAMNDLLMSAITMGKD